VLLGGSLGGTPAKACVTSTALSMFPRCCDGQKTPLQHPRADVDVPALRIRS
jgi:hypothetical protein